MRNKWRQRLAFFFTFLWIGVAAMKVGAQVAPSGAAGTVYQELHTTYPDLPTNALAKIAGDHADSPEAARQTTENYRKIYTYLLEHYPAVAPPALSEIAYQAGNNPSQAVSLTEDTIYEAEQIRDATGLQLPAAQILAAYNPGDLPSALAQAENTKNSATTISTQTGIADSAAQILGAWDSVGELSRVASSTASLQNTLDSLTDSLAMGEKAGQITAVLNLFTPGKLDSEAQRLSDIAKQIQNQATNAISWDAAQALAALNFGHLEGALHDAAEFSDTLSSLKNTYGAVLNSNFLENIALANPGDLSRALSRITQIFGGNVNLLDSLKDIMGNFDSLESLEKVLGDLGDIESLVKNLGDLDKLTQQLGDLDNLAKQLGDLGDLAKQIGDLDGLLKDLGDLDKMIGDLSKLKDLESVLGDLEKLGNLSDLIGKLGNLENLVSQLGDLNDLVGKLGDLEGLVGKIGNLEDLVGKLGDLDNLIGNLDSLKDLSNIIGQLGDLSDALKELDSLSNLVDKFGDLSKLVNQLGDLDKLLGQLGDLNNLLGNLGDMQKLLGNLGDLSNLLGSFGDLQKLLGSFGDLSSLLNNFGNIQDLLNNFGNLQDLFGNFDKLSDLLNNFGDLQNLLGNLGNLDKLLGNLGNLGNLVDGLGNIDNLLGGLSDGLGGVLGGLSDLGDALGSLGGTGGLGGLTEGLGNLGSVVGGLSSTLGGMFGGGDGGGPTSSFKAGYIENNLKAIDKYSAEDLTRHLIMDGYQVYQSPTQHAHGFYYNFIHEDNTLDLEESAVPLLRANDYKPERLNSAETYYGYSANGFDNEGKDLIIESAWIAKMSNPVTCAIKAANLFYIKNKCDNSEESCEKLYVGPDGKEQIPNQTKYTIKSLMEKVTADIGDDKKFKGRMPYCEDLYSIVTDATTEAQIAADEHLSDEQKDKMYIRLALQHLEFYLNQYRTGYIVQVSRICPLTAGAVTKSEAELLAYTFVTPSCGAPVYQYPGLTIPGVDCGETCDWSKATDQVRIFPFRYPDLFSNKNFCDQTASNYPQNCQTSEDFSYADMFEEYYDPALTNKNFLLQPTQMKDLRAQQVKKRQNWSASAASQEIKGTGNTINCEDYECGGLAGHKLKEALIKMINSSGSGSAVATKLEGPNGVTGSLESYKINTSAENDVESEDDAYNDYKDRCRKYIGGGKYCTYRAQAKISYWIVLPMGEEAEEIEQVLTTPFFQTEDMKNFLKKDSRQYKKLNVTNIQSPLGDVKTEIPGAGPITNIFFQQEALYNTDQKIYQSFANCKSVVDYLENRCADSGENSSDSESNETKTSPTTPP